MILETFGKIDKICDYINISVKKKDISIKILVNIFFIFVIIKVLYIANI